MVGSNYRQRGLDTASVRSRRYQVAEQENRTVPSTSSPVPADTIRRMEDQSLVVLSALLDCSCCSKASPDLTTNMPSSCSNLAWHRVKSPADMPPSWTS